MTLTTHGGAALYFPLCAGYDGKLTAVSANISGGRRPDPLATHPRRDAHPFDANMRYITAGTYFTGILEMNREYRQY